MGYHAAGRFQNTVFRWLLATAGLFGVLSASGCSVHRVYLSVEPENFEGHFVRTCETLDPNAPDTGLRAHPATMAALSAIRPAGRFCFVCRRLRRCTKQLNELEIDFDPTAREMSVRAMAGQSNVEPNNLPPPGGPRFSAAREALCRACASMPRRIQLGTWVEDNP